MESSLSIIKVTIDMDHIFDLENMIYLMLLSKRKHSNSKIIICINDMIVKDKQENTNNKYIRDITDQLTFLKRCGIVIHNIVYYSQYYTHAFLYLDRLVKFHNMRIVPDERISINPDLMEYDTNKLFHSYPNLVKIVFDRIKDSIVLSNCGKISAEIYEAVIDDIIRADYAYDLSTPIDMDLLTNISMILGLKRPIRLTGLNPDDGGILNCPIHLLSHSCFSIATDIESYNIDYLKLESELIRVGMDILKRIESQILDLDQIINEQVDDKYRRILVNAIKMKIDGTYNNMIDNQDIMIKDAIYLEKDFQNTINKIKASPEKVAKVRLRFGTNIRIRNKKGELIGEVDNAKKKTKVAYNWLPETEDLIELVDSTNGSNVYILDFQNFKDKIGIIKYRNTIMYTVYDKDSLKKTNGWIESVGDSDWFAPIGSSQPDGSNRANHRVYLMYPIS